MSDLLPPKFLTQISHLHQLSPEQESVFLRKFGEDKSDQAIASEIGISEEAYRKRLGEIYRKFNIEGKGPGKHNRLLYLLQERFEHHDRPQPDGTPQLENFIRLARSKSQASLIERCSSIRVLDMSQPVGLEDIYTNVNVLVKITSRRRLGISELMADYTSHSSNRLELQATSEDRIPAIEALQSYSKLIVIGKPGAGKTTFLKHTALQCIQGGFWSDRLPIFITLRQFASAANRPKMFEYILQEFNDYGIGDNSVIEQILRQGKALILLDGLDEVREEDAYRVTEEISNFTEQFYHNHFAISSRIASYQFVFEKFTEVEVANFEPLQIATFAARWFATNPENGTKLVQKLNLNKPIQELATNPLLLTLLCLVFEDCGDFPTNRSELYKEGLDVLLKKWDAKRNIERHQIYKKLSLQRKESLLSQVALSTFERGDYFFKQADLEQSITDYIRNLPHVNTSPDVLQLDSEAILKSIEAQHGIFVERAKGIYSFSHLTFHEYLAAREIAVSADTTMLTKLAAHIADQRWDDVILLAVSMLRCADDLMLLLKQQIDALVASDPQIQDFLHWINQKSLTVATAHPPHTIRSFYLALGRALINANSSNLAYILARILVLDLDLIRNQVLQLNLALDLTRAFDLELDLGLDLELDLNLALEYARESNMAAMAVELEVIVEACPDDSASDSAWKVWAEQLRKVAIAHRQIGQDWQFSQAQKLLLRQYDQANALLIDCLNSDCYITQATRQKITQTLLLPASLIHPD